jgi:hypothetical protein
VIAKYEQASNTWLNSAVEYAKKQIDVYVFPDIKETDYTSKGLPWKWAYQIDDLKDIATIEEKSSTVPEWMLLSLADMEILHKLDEQASSPMTLR